MKTKNSIQWKTIRAIILHLKSFAYAKNPLVKTLLPGLAKKSSAGSRKRWCKLCGSTVTKLLDLSRASNFCSWTCYFLYWNCMDQFGHFIPCAKDTNTKGRVLTLLCKAPVQETHWISVRADTGVPIAVLSKTSEHYKSKYCNGILH